MAHHNSYNNWPLLTCSEFELACSLFDQRYIIARSRIAKLNFILRHCSSATTGETYIQILRPLEVPENLDALSLALKRLEIIKDDRNEHEFDMKTELMDEEADEEALNPSDTPPKYTLLPNQPFVSYEIHLHPTYRVPTLWFTIHSLSKAERALDINMVNRYLVSANDQIKLSSVGITGGLSAAPHPVTHVPAFFIHPCQTKEAMENFDCPLGNYIMLWIGLVGGSVGLWLPPEMAVYQ